MARLAWVILRWRLLAARFQRRIRAGAADAWLDSMRLRICSFLLARYGSAPDAMLAPPSAKSPPALEPWRRNRAPPPAPEDRPPKPTAALAPLLRDISAQNRRQRDRFRWRLWP